MSRHISRDYISTFDDNYITRGRKMTAHQMETGITLHEQANGHHADALNAAIRAGVKQVALMFGREQVPLGQTGTSRYDPETRREIRELARMTETDVSSVTIGELEVGMSGWNGKEFNPDAQKAILEQIQKTIDFAADATRGAHVTMHYNEWQRSFNDLPEQDRQQMERTPGSWQDEPIQFATEEGQIVGLAASQEIPLHRYTRDENGDILVDTKNGVGGTDTLNYFDMKRIYEEQCGSNQDAFKQYLYDNYNIKIHNFVSDDPVADAFVKGFQIQNINRKLQELDQLDISKNNSMSIIDARRRQGLMSDEEAEKRIREIDANYDNVRAQQEAELEKNKDMIQKLRPLKEIGLKRSADAMAQMAAYARQKQIEKAREEHERGNKDFKFDRAIAISPEVWAHQHYGNHPDEIIELTRTARDHFVHRLTEEFIDDPANREDKTRRNADGKFDKMKIPNPYYDASLVKKYGRDGAKKEAAKMAREHIRSTLDIQHLFEWKEKFKRHSGESEAQFEKRWKQWYLEQIQKLADADVVGNVHVVEGIRSHDHNPIGTGDLPVGEAFDILRESAMKTGEMAFVAEGHIFGHEQQIKQAWRYSGKGVADLYRINEPAGYGPFGETRGEFAMIENFGAYRAPFGEFTAKTAHDLDAEDFTPWSGVRLE